MFRSQRACMWSVFTASTDSRMAAAALEPRCWPWTPAPLTGNRQERGLWCWTQLSVSARRSSEIAWRMRTSNHSRDGGAPAAGRAISSSRARPATASSVRPEFSCCVASSICSGGGTSPPRLRMISSSILTRAAFMKGLRPGSVSATIRCRRSAMSLVLAVVWLAAGGAPALRAVPGVAGVPSGAAARARKAVSAEATRRIPAATNGYERTDRRSRLGMRQGSYRTPGRRARVRPPRAGWIPGRYSTQTSSALIVPTGPV